jgi:hypothetical protein
MTIQVFRVYTDMNMEPEKYAFSILASAADAHYVIPEQNKDKFNFDDTRIEELTRAAYEADMLMPEDPIGWASLAMINMGYMAMDEAQTLDYTSLEDAEEDEIAFAESVLTPPITEEEEAK